MSGAGQDDSTGRVAIVTGSSTGIGQAVAASLAREGYSVVVTSRTQERADAAAQELLDAKLSAVGVALDVADPDQIERLFAVVDDRFGRLDVLVNNAGVAAAGDSTTFALRKWAKVMALNLTAPFLCAQLAAPRMAAGGGGVIINVASIFGTIASPGRAAYVSSKHGLIGLTKVLGTEWAPLGIRVVAVAPAYVNTNLIEQAVSSGNFNLDATLARTPMKRLGTTDEVADVVSFLVSDRASYVTGSTIYVDGGWVGYGGQ